MKIVIATLLSSILYADTLFVLEAIEGESKKVFLKIDGDSCYYKNSSISPKNCYKETGNIFIISKSRVESALLKKYNLEFLKEINRENGTSLYKSLDSSIDSITLVNKINRENSTLKARVEWLSPRRVF